MKISILLLVRKNSKFFSKWLISYLRNTFDFNNIELLIMASKHDTWNQDFFQYYEDKFKVYYEDKKMGKNGRSVYYNELAGYSTGDFIWHMCDDHYFISERYDKYLVEFIERKKINPHAVNIILPLLDNTGSVSHLVSRKWYEVLGRMGEHPAIDSYINGVIDRFPYPDRIHNTDRALLHDFTVEEEIMTPKHHEIELDYSISFPDFRSEETDNEMTKDGHKLYQAVQNGL